jgi:hypothetical protein
MHAHTTYSIVAKFNSESGPITRITAVTSTKSVFLTFYIHSPKDCLELVALCVIRWCHCHQIYIVMCMSQTYEHARQSLYFLCLFSLQSWIQSCVDMTCHFSFYDLFSHIQTCFGMSCLNGKNVKLNLQKSWISFINYTRVESEYIEIPGFSLQINWRIIRTQLELLYTEFLNFCPNVLKIPWWRMST